jgi:2-polyprenyl-3-methyl-5-hydroxy-6-metoxy-1,4-benzoquinol methylase
MDRLRFNFGGNWLAYSKKIDLEVVRGAEESLRAMLERDRLDGTTFLDLGCGSGLFSLAAHNLGAAVTSFDFDPNCVACCEALRKNFASSDQPWVIFQGSVLDDSFCRGLGVFDCVYAWGVLHHTGDLWRAVSSAISLVEPCQGSFFVSIYNDQGAKSRIWLKVKRLYNLFPRYLRPLLPIAYVLADFFRSLFSLRMNHYLHKVLRYRSNRGMSYWNDVIDWVGGYPFEVASVDAVFIFVRSQGFQLQNLKTSTGGCNQFVFVRHQGSLEVADEGAC